MLDRRGNQLLVAALLVTLVLWNVPYGYVALYPFKLFATWLHEGSHGLLMIVTGAGLGSLEIFRDTSGLAHAARGVSAPAQAAISSAGYMGTALFGALFLVLGRSARGGRWVLGTLGVVMIASVALAIRNPFGVVAISLAGAALVALALRGGERVCAFAVTFLAVEACINAVLDVRVLFGDHFVVNGREHAGSDADTVAGVLGLPSFVPALTWLVWSLAMVYVGLRLVAPREVARPVRVVA